MCRFDSARAQECHNVVKNHNEFWRKNRLAEAPSNVAQKIFYFVQLSYSGSCSWSGEPEFGGFGWVVPGCF